MYGQVKSPLSSTGRGRVTTPQTQVPQRRPSFSPPVFPSLRVGGAWGSTALEMDASIRPRGTGTGQTENSTNLAPCWPSLGLWNLTLPCHVYLQSLSVVLSYPEEYNFSWIFFEINLSHRRVEDDRSFCVHSIWHVQYLSDVHQLPPHLYCSVIHSTSLKVLALRSPLMSW